MDYRRMPIEIESPEQVGYGNIRCNLTESSVTDMPLSALGLDLTPLILAYTDHLGKPALRDLIAGGGRGLTRHDVIVTPCAAAALFITATALLGKGDHLVVMHHGRIVSEGPPLETIDDRVIADVYGISGAVGRLPAASVPFVLPQSRHTQQSKAG